MIGRARRRLVAGNWKMHTTYAEALELAEQIRRTCSEVTEVEVALLPPFPWIVPLAERLQGSAIILGAQNCSAYEQGAYTGEVSACMIAPFCRYVIVGHSERRRLFGETDDVVAAKVSVALRHGLRPILCVGELLEEREAGATLDVIERQLRMACAPLSADTCRELVIAYEPVWAIGTGRAALPLDAQLVSAWIRRWLVERFGAVATDIRILYGGSVTAQNAPAFFAEPAIDGALVGGASLNAEQFCAIVRAASRVETGSLQ